MSTTRIKDTDYADVALYDKVNQIADEIDAEVESKQPKLIAGENVIIQGNTISAKGGALGDEITVITTEDDKAQAIGVIEKNKSKPKYDWIGTLAEYQSQAVATNHPDWVCYITDDNTADAYEAYSKTETDELLNGVEEVVETKLDDKHRTNCITEIPQDIKLEFVDGTLTLKAGSKVYVPNGANTFDVVNITSDKVFNSTDERKWFLAYDVDNGVIFGNFNTSVNIGSGTTEPPAGFYGFYYNTSTNLLYDYRDGVKNRKCSLPFCIASSSTSSWSIEQVFNGFGYIGRTVFALPGLTYLVPNGFNEDGTLRNTKIVTNKVLVHEKDSSINSREFVPLFLSADGYVFPRGYDYTFSKTGKTYNTYYDSSTNKMYYNGNSTTYTEYADAFLGYANIDSGGRYTAIKDATVFNPLTIRDKQTLTNLSTPSTTYVNLTVGATGTTYTAPATGWFSLAAQGNDIRLWCARYGQCGGKYTANFASMVSVYAKKGDVIMLQYSSCDISASWCYFRFVYAEGSL